MTKKKHSDRASNYTAVQPLDFEPQNAKELKRSPHVPIITKLDRN